jgi:hypothetical protein
VGDWVLGLGDIEDDDPEKPNEEGANHRRSEPAGAFKLERICLRRNEVGAVIFLLLADTRFRHSRKVKFRIYFLLLGLNEEQSLKLFLI